MIYVLKSDDFELRPGGTIKFEGGPYGTPISFFHVKDKPGGGPVMHRHPYPETWIVRRGTPRFTVGAEQVEAQPGDIVVAPANVPHKFLNIGTDLLELVCIHPSPFVIQEDLE